MPWKKIFCALVMYVPSMALAQKKNNTTGKPIAEHITEGTAINTVPLVATSVLPEATAIKTTDKVKTANTVPQPAAKLTERSRNATGDQYIPLAGEIAYFGKNNDAVLTYTKNYYIKNQNHFVTIQQRGKRHFPVIDKTFSKRDVPLEMKYLSVIESALTNKALSRVGALGPWQFMPTTGQFMGLVVNGKVDERTDWNKSTNAAAKYVNYLYDMLGDWLLVVAAYNSGPRPVLNAINKTGKSDFFAIKKYLPAETQNHVMAFVATATIMERMNNFIGQPLPADFDWKSLNVKGPSGLLNPDGSSEKPKNPLSLRFSDEEIKSMAILRLNNPIDLDVLASALEIDRRMVGKWNFDYFKSLDAFKDGSSKQFLVRIPKDKLETFLEKKNEIEKHKVDLSAFD
jgi:membrane-bound lytic murein transglycosylase D